MTNYDVFNGDADGICSLIQLRHAEPREAQLVSGVKRNINLLSGISVSEGDRLTVLDISLDKNLKEVQEALVNKAEVFYVDHHYSGDIPDDPNLTTIINEAPDICTSLLINGHLSGQFPEWAVTGAFGDNLKQSARALGKTLNLAASDVDALEALGIYINYNGYGSSLEDLHFAPTDLYLKLCGFSNPLEFYHSNNADFARLEEGYRSDMHFAKEVEAMYRNDNVAVFILPNEPWARRVSGVYSNDLTNAFPDRAHGVLTKKENGHFLVSVRAPLNNKQGAVDLCRQFPTGGGRAAAAGINDLPAAELENFIAKLSKSYG
ncbi:MAG: acetyltransferase [Pseudomonadales bacterium]|nr:acetyltransferase [Pseudomonadales bacterium]